MLLTQAVVQTVEKTVSMFDRVTFAIAVIGFLLSIYNFVASLVVNSKRMEISVKQMYKCNGFVGMVIEFTNKSRLNISITSGQIVLGDDQRLQFGETSILAIAQRLPYMDHDTVAKPALFPVRLDPLTSVRVFMQTDHWSQDLPHRCTLVLPTSRGNIRAKVDLPDALETGLQLLRYLE